MTRRLLCITGHEWVVEDGASWAPEVPRCRVCGAPPGLGCEIGWELRPLRLLVQLAVVTGPIGTFIVLVFVAPGWEVGRAWKVGAMVLLMIGYLALDWLARRDGQRRLRALCRALGMRYEGALPAPAVAGLPEWEVKGRLANWGEALTGRLLGASVLVSEVQFRGGKRPPRMTVVAFTDPVPGLLDFDLEPIGRQRWLTLSQVVEAMRNPQPPALTGEPIGDVYRLHGPGATRLDEWLSRPARDLLARHPGWVIQARRGQLLVCRDHRVCPVEGLPTLLAVAFHFRLLFLSGTARAAPARG